MHVNYLFVNDDVRKEMQALKQMFNKLPVSHMTKASNQHVKQNMDCTNIVISYSEPERRIFPETT